MRHVHNGQVLKKNEPDNYGRIIRSIKLFQNARPPLNKLD